MMWPGRWPPNQHDFSDAVHPPPLREARSIITSLSGPDFETDIQVVPTTAVSSNATTATVTLAGDAINANDLWRVALTAGGFTTTHTYTVSAADKTLEDVAGGLADDINTSAAGGYVVSVVGNTLIIANINGAAFTVTATSPADCLAEFARPRRRPGPFA